MSKEVELARLKIAADIIADVDRRNMFRVDAADLDDIEDRLLALASRLSDARRYGDFASDRNNAVERPN